MTRGRDRSSILGQMRARVRGAIERERSSVGVVPAEAARAVPDGMLTVHIATHRNGQARAGASARLLGELQGDLVKSDDVVLADRARFFVAQDAVEIDAVQGPERRRRVGGSVSELVVGVGQEALG